MCPDQTEYRYGKKVYFAEQLSEPDSSTPMSRATMVLVGADLKKVIDCCHNTLLAAGSNGMSRSLNCSTCRRGQVFENTD
jgi:hypothetical protein